MSSEQERLQWLTDHLTYEVMMLRYAAASLKRPLSQYEWNAHLESFAVHARNLYEFLTNEPDSRNMRASDFVDFEANKTDATIGRFLTFSQQVLHMGKRRKDTDDGKIALADVDVLLNWTEQNLGGFISKVGEPYRSTWSEDAATPKAEYLPMMNQGPTGPGVFQSGPSATNNPTCTSIGVR